MVRHAPTLPLLLFVSSLSLAANDPPSAEQIVENAIPSIVAIRAETAAGVSSGTGFIVGPSGVIVANLHVIESARRATVKLHSGEQYTKVMISSYDEGRDLAVLRIPGFELPTLDLGDSDGVKVGATVYAIGNPLGLEESVTKGIVSSIRVGDDGTKIIQTDSAVSPGNSGGPLINESGEAVGIVTFKVRGGENLNFAIPANYARALLGFETLMTLDELASELREDRVSLFAVGSKNPDDTLTGTWLSLTTNTLRELRQSGEYLYGSYNFDNRAENMISNGTIDLERNGPDSYEGHATSNWSCEWGSIANTCSTVHDVRLRVVAPNRIEGVWEEPEYKDDWSKREYRKFCESCGSKMPPKSSDFVWVRQD